MADKQIQELNRKVRALVLSRFGGDYKRMFDHYARKRLRSGSVNHDELYALLKDADVGNGLTRSAWADGIMRQLDKDADGFLSFVEFQSIER